MTGYHLSVKKRGGLYKPSVYRTGGLTPYFKTPLEVRHRNQNIWYLQNISTSIFRNLDLFVHRCQLNSNMQIHLHRKLSKQIWMQCIEGHEKRVLWPKDWKFNKCTLQIFLSPQNNNISLQCHSFQSTHFHCTKVIIEKSRGEVPPMGQDTIETVS